MVIVGGIDGLVVGFGSGDIIIEFFLVLLMLGTFGELIFIMWVFFIDVDIGVWVMIVLVGVIWVFLVLKYFIVGVVFLIFICGLFLDSNDGL